MQGDNLKIYPDSFDTERHAVNDELVRVNALKAWLRTSGCIPGFHLVDVSVPERPCSRINTQQALSCITLLHIAPKSSCGECLRTTGNVRALRFAYLFGHFEHR